MSGRRWAAAVLLAAVALAAGAGDGGASGVTLQPPPQLVQVAVPPQPQPHMQQQQQQQQEAWAASHVAAHDGSPAAAPRSYLDVVIGAELQSSGSDASPQARRDGLLRMVRSLLSRTARAHFILISEQPVRPGETPCALAAVPACFPRAVPGWCTHVAAKRGLCVWHARGCLTAPTTADVCVAATQPAAAARQPHTPGGRVAHLRRRRAPPGAAHVGAVVAVLLLRAGHRPGGATAAGRPR
jgi:hypothetical protein